MKIFTLLQNLLKMITGQTGRNLSFISAKRKAQSPKPNSLSSSNERIPQVDTSLQNMMTSGNDALISREDKILPVRTTDVPAPQKYFAENKIAPVQSADIPASQKYSFEYKILSVQQTKTSVPNSKPVVMQNFFAIVKKIFSLSDHPTTLLENLNEGYHPGCHYGTAGRENISLTNQLHDVANEAASFGLIPITLTPTAMSHPEKKSVKTITGRSGLVGILMLMSSLFFVSSAFSQGIQTFNTAGAATFTVPAGVTSITVKVWGGGGAGGGTNKTSFNTNVVNGGGGAGGAFATNTLTVTPGAQFNLFVAAQTTSTNTSSATTNTGASSWFGSTSTIFAQGGQGGGPAGNATGTAGTGSATLSLPNATAIAGGSGGAGNTSSTGSVGGAGANSGGAGGAGVTSTGSNGTDGTAPGGGGSGGRTNSVFAGQFTGGAGAAGQVTVTWTCPTATISYPAASFCSTTTSTLVTIAGTTGGTFSSTSGLSINTTTGEINPSLSTVGGPYTVTYNIPASSGCTAVNAIALVTINPNPITTVNGSTNITCNGANDGTITIAVTGGTPDYFFSVDNGVNYTSQSHTSPYTFPGLSPNTPYQIRVRDSKGCISQSVQ